MGAWTDSAMAMAPSATSGVAGAGLAVGRVWQPAKVSRLAASVDAKIFKRMNVSLY